MNSQAFVIRMRLIPVAALSILLAACNGVATVQPMDAHGVSLNLSRDGTTANGDQVTIRIANVGADAVYLERCGDGPALTFNKWDGSQWLPTGAVSCTIPVNSSPVSLAPGATLMVSRLLTDAGLYRVALGVGVQQNLSDEQVATSNSVEVTLR